MNSYKYLTGCLRDVFGGAFFGAFSTCIVWEFSNAIDLLVRGNTIIVTSFTLCGFYPIYRICLAASQLAIPPRLWRPTKFGDVNLTNPSLMEINARSLGFGFLLLATFLLIAGQYAIFRGDGGLAGLNQLRMIVLIMIAVAGLVHGICRTVKRNGLSAGSPPVQDYSLFLRPYPARPWITTVANLAASNELVVVADPSGSDVWSINSYLSVAVSTHKIPRFYWTEGDHWLLTVADVAAHAQQVIVDMSDWDSRSNGPRGVHQELLQTMLRQREVQVAFLAKEGITLPNWLPIELVVAYTPYRISYSPRYRKALAIALRDTLQESTDTDQYLQFQRHRRAVDLAAYLDKLHTEDIVDTAHGMEFDQVLRNFIENNPPVENITEKETADADVLAQAEKLITRGELREAKQELELIAKGMPEYYSHRSELGSSLQIRSTNFTEFLHEAISEGQMSGKKVEWIPQVYPRVCFLLGWISMEENDLMNAVTWLQRGIHYSPNDAELLSELGTAYNKAGLYEQAHETFSRILKLGVGGIQRARALRGKGYALVELKHYTEAKDCYLKSLVLDPDSEIARSELREIDQLTRNRDT